MTNLTIEIPTEIYGRLEKRSQQLGKTLERYLYELIEKALIDQEQPSTRDVLQAAGRIRPLSDELRRKIIPGITLDEVHSIMAKSPKPELSEIILEQRGTKA